VSQRQAGISRRAGLIALFAGAFCIASSAVWVRLSELGPVATANLLANFAPIFVTIHRPAVATGGGCLH